VRGVGYLIGRPPLTRRRGAGAGPAFVAPKRVPVFVVTGVPCPDCECLAWQVNEVNLLAPP
jgi:hypothetical protein